MLLKVYFNCKQPLWQWCTRLVKIFSLQMGFLGCWSIWWCPVRVNLQVCYISLILIVLWNPLFSEGFQQRFLTNDLGPNSALRCRHVIPTDSRGTSMSISESTILFSVCEIVAQMDKRISCTFILVTPSIQEHGTNPPTFLFAQFVLFLTDQRNSSAVTWIYIFLYYFLLRSLLLFREVDTEVQWYRNYCLSSIINKYTRKRFFWGVGEN